TQDCSTQPELCGVISPSLRPIFLALEHQGPGISCAIKEDAISFASLRLEFVDASGDAIVVGEEPHPGTISFFQGMESARWRSGIPSYRSVLYRGIYPCTDVRVRAASRVREGEIPRLEYDLLFQPGADPRAVMVRCPGTELIEIEEDGALAILTAKGFLHQPPPQSWQELPNGDRHPIECRYRIIDRRTFGFEATEIAPEASFVIDPILAYVGGCCDDDGFGVTLDPAGSVYVCGDTSSWDLPFPEGIEPTPLAGSYDAFVMKVDRDCTSILWTAVLGGWGTDRAFDVKVTSEGKVLLVGSTDSGESFPVTPGALQEAPEGSREAFVAVLNPNPELNPEDQLLYSSFLGENGDEVATGVAPGPEHSVYVAGYTTSPGFQTTTGAFDTTHNGGIDIFLVRLAPNLSLPPSDQLLYSTFIGGTGDDGWPSDNIYIQSFAPDLQVGEDEVVTLAGCTRSTNFPTTAGGFAPGPLGGWDAYVLRLRADNSLPPEQQLLASTRLGGNGDDLATGLSLEPPGFVSIIGETKSSNFPVTGDAFQNSLKGGLDAYAARLSLSLDSIQYATFLGGSAADGAWAGTADHDGRLYFCGFIYSADFPLPPGAFKGSRSGEYDALFAILDPRRSPREQLVYSSYIGGSLGDETWDVALSDNGYAFLTGYSGGQGFEVGGDPGAFDDTFGGVSDAFLARFPIWFPEPSFSANPASGDAPLSVSLDAAASTTPAGTEIRSYAWDFGDGSTDSGLATQHTFLQPGRYTISLTVVNDLGAITVVRKTVTARCSPGDVAPWIAVDVGTPTFPGCAWKNGDDLLLCTGGTRLTGLEDELYFVYQEAIGDFSLVMYIKEVLSWNIGASLSLMAREDTAPTSRSAAILLYRSSATTSNFRFRFRKETTASNRTGSSAKAPRWLKLERRGSEFIAYSSADGTAWQEVDRETINLAQTLLVGVGGCGADPGDETQPFTPLQARVSGLAILAPSAAFLRGDSNADGSTNISDPVFNLNYQFALGPTPTCLKTADVNDDGLLNLADPIFQLNYMFVSGPTPPPPLSECGIDPTADALSCEEYAPCRR
ncbi:MAG: PKD domain-containing protein, partial [Armatimonadetes bacterium]|nr:PKD domain-containing protein [Armatimonadota bacterium]